MRLGWSIAVVCIVTKMLAVSAAAQTSPDSSRTRRIADDAWFQRGRDVPGQTAAELRYRAFLQKLAMRARRKTAASDSGSVWVPLGPAPLASDATGLGEQNYNWVSGRATAVAVDPADATGNTVYIGGAYGGVWKSTNAATQNPANVVWSPQTDAQPTLAIGAIAVEPWSSALQTCNDTTQQSLVLVGTGETDSSSDSYYGLGILRSADAGNTWTLITTDSTGARNFAGLGFSKIAFNTSTPTFAVAAAGATSEGVVEGLENPVTVNRGLYYSPDCGQSWAYANVSDASGPISPGSATSVFYNAAAATFFAAIRYHGFYSSIDGINWTRLLNQPGAGLTTTACPSQESSPSMCPIYRGEIAVVPGRNEMYVWYVDANDIDQGIWRSNDGGVTWMQLDETGIFYCGDELGGCGTEDGTYNLELAAVPDGQATDLYAGAVNLYKCTISSVFPTCSPNVSPPPPPSATFLNLTHVYGCPPDLGSIAHVHPSQHAEAFMLLNANTQELMYFANDGGIYRALDGYTGLLTGMCRGTNNFDSLNQTLGSMTQFVAFAQSPTNPNTMLGGSQGNGSPATASAEGNTQWLNVNTADGGYSIINPANEDEWFTENTGVSIQKCESGINCTSGDFNNGLIVSNATLGGDIGPPFTPYILDPQNLGEMLVGTCRVWRGATDGTGFVALSGNFDYGGLPVCSGSETNQVRGLATGGPKDPNGLSYVIYAVTDGQGPNSSVSPSGGHVLVTTNAPQGPNSWMNQTGSINPNVYPVSSVVMDPTDNQGNTAYVTIMGFGVSHIWQTTNAGTTWTDFTANLPDAPANTIVIDPGANPRSGTLYVGTDVGVFTSSSASPSWTEVGPMATPGAIGFLPNVAITGLAIFNNQGEKKLRASTYGRGIWEYALLATPDFKMTVANNPLTVFTGNQGSFQVTLTAVNGYSGTVTLSCANGLTAPPSACTASGNARLNSNTPSANITVTVGGTPGTYNFDLQGIDQNNLTHYIALMLQIEGFSLGIPSPPAITLGTPATSGPITLEVSATGPFSDAVELSCGPPVPAGVSCNFSPATIDPTSAIGASSTLTISTSATTLANTYTLIILATGSPAIPGAPVISQTLALTVTPDFSLTLNNHSATAPQNSPATFTGTVSTLDGYSDRVQLSCGTDAPPTCTLNPASVTPSATGSPFVITVQSDTVANYNFNIIASGSNGTTHSVPVSFASTNRAAGPDYAIAISNPLLSAPVSTLATFSGTLIALDGYNSAVDLNCSANAPPSCTPIPATVTPTASGAPFTVNVSSSVAQNYSFNVVAKGTDSARITHSFSVTFSASSFSFINNTAAQTVPAGGSATYNLTFDPGGSAISNAVTFSCNNPPATVACKFSPAQAPAGSAETSVTLNLITSSSTPSLSSTITVIATSGAASANAAPPIMLTVLGTSQGTGPFTINTDTNTQTVAAGQMATYTFALSTTANFTHPVTFSCSGVPAESVCSFSPPQLVPGSPDQPAITTMQITTTAQVLASMHSPDCRYSFLTIALPGLFALLLLPCARQRRPRLVRSGILLGLILLSALLPSCGGGTGIAGGQPGTPSGAYTIMVTGTAGTITETASPSVTLTVQ